MPSTFPERREPQPIITVARFRQIIAEQIEELGLLESARAQESHSGINVSIGPTTTMFPFDALTHQGNREDQFESWVRTKLNWLIQKRQKLDRADNTVKAVLSSDQQETIPVKDSFRHPIKKNKGGRPRKNPVAVKEVTESNG